MKRARYSMALSLVSCSFAAHAGCQLGSDVPSCLPPQQTVYNAGCWTAWEDHPISTGETRCLPPGLAETSPSEPLGAPHEPIPTQVDAPQVGRSESQPAANAPVGEPPVSSESRWNASSFPPPSSDLPRNQWPPGTPSEAEAALKISQPSLGPVDPLPAPQGQDARDEAASDEARNNDPASDDPASDDAANNEHDSNPTEELSFEHPKTSSLTPGHDLSDLVQQWLATAEAPMPSSSQPRETCQSELASQFLQSQPPRNASLPVRRSRGRSLPTGPVVSRQVRPAQSSLPSDQDDLPPADSRAEFEPARTLLPHLGAGRSTEPRYPVVRPKITEFDPESYRPPTELKRAGDRGLLYPVLPFRSGARPIGRPADPPTPRPMSRDALREESRR